MRQITIAALALALLGSHAARVWNVGFQQLTIASGADTPIAIGIWYPTEARPQATRLRLFTQTVALDAPVRGEGLPLVAISHGTGGSLAAHYDTAIALRPAADPAARAAAIRPACSR